ncbi:hypothetical protein SDC9_84146 [bioreactor metagenome]|uniref:Uncharacterized protein n=1 Tax=bioreactor metagenome TaxID=1076179 RepID=A0A644ZB64_9ZZZZ
MGDFRGHQSLIGVDHTGQVRQICRAVPDVVDVFGGSSVAGMVVGLGVGAAVPGKHASGFIRRPVGDFISLIQTAVYLAVGCIAQVKAIAAMLVKGNSGVGPGADRLCLQGLQRPGVAHFVGNNALDIVLQRQDVHHREVSPVQPLIAEAAVIPKALKPGDRFQPVRQPRTDSKGAAVPAVKLKQDFCRFRSHSRHAKGAGAHDGGIGNAQGGLGAHRPVPAAIGARADIVGAAGPGYKAAADGISRRFRRLKAAVAARQLNVIAADDGVAARGRGVIISPALKIEVLGFQHGNLLFLSIPQRDKLKTVAEVPEAIAAVYAVLQVRAGQDRAAVK